MPALTDALALAETPAAPSDDALLARAAELTAPLPPMPVPNVGPGATIKEVAPASADDVSKLFGPLSIDAFKTPAAAARSRDNSGVSQQ